MSQSKPTVTIILNEEQLAAVRYCFNNEIVRLRFVGNPKLTEWITTTQKEIGNQIAEQGGPAVPVVRPQAETP